MAKKTEEFKHESLQDQDAIINYLKAVIEGFKKGKILLSDEDDSITLTPEKLAELKIKAKQSDKKQSVSLKFSWSFEGESNTEEAPLFIDAQKKQPNKKKKK